MPDYEGSIPPAPEVREQVQSLQRLVLEGIRVFNPIPIKGSNAHIRNEAAWMIAAHLYVNGARVEKRRNRPSQPIRRIDAEG
jgi:hypothetical protein